MDDNRITYFAETDSRNKRVPFGIKSKDRLRHLYTIGKTGMGKSTLLENMAIQDIRNGEGVAFIDPHGKTADLLLDYIPADRVKDVIYFAPFDTQHPISFNVMEDVGPDRRHLVVSGLMSTFEKIWVDAWSARMAYILQNTLAALLEFPGATLLGVNRMLSDKAYRTKVVDNIKDSTVKSFWVDEFAKYTERFAAEATPAIQNKVGQFTSNPLVRNIIGQPKSSFDMRKIMDEKKIFIVNLSKGLVGENNANLIGSMLITKIYLSAMSRADVTEAELGKLPNFYLYVDEFQSFANKSFADILSEARKYKLALNIAHQYIEQMAEEVRAAVFGNVGTMIAYRVGSFDAEVLEKEFAPVFTAEDIVNLGKYQMYLKLMIDGVASQPFSAVGMAPIPKPEDSYRTPVIESSRRTFGHPRQEVERVINEWYAPIVDVRNHKSDQPHQGPNEARGRKEEKGQGPSRRESGERKDEPRKEQGTEGTKREEKSNALGNALAQALAQTRKDIKPEVKAEEKITVSLNVLGQDNKKKDKGPTEKNKNALAEALAQIKSTTNSKQSAVRTGTPALTQSASMPKTADPLETVDSRLKTGPKEVPEDVLRKVLAG